jgi:hypothetical protein
MKLVGTLQGVCIIKFSLEEVSPLSGVQIPKVQSLIQTTYKAKPMAAITLKPPTAGEFQPVNFGGGQFTDGDNSYAVPQIMIAANGLMVTAQNTEVSGKIMDHLAGLLDSDLDFRLKDADVKRFYVSALVVKFERNFEDYIAPLRAIREIVQSAMGRADGVAVKRLSLGPSGDAGPFVTIDSIEVSDFIIERRAGSPFSDNRYFTIAPVTTESHLEMLQRIEDAIPATSA